MLRLEGRFDFHAVEPFLTALTHAENSHHPRHIILDMGRVTFIDSMAIARLVGTWQRLHRDSVRFTLAGQSGYVDTALKEINLERMIPTASSLEEALALPHPETRNEKE